MQNSLLVNTDVFDWANVNHSLFGQTPTNETRGGETSELDKGILCIKD
jgi:hypothetical protein